MWDGEFFVKNAMEQTCEIEINLCHFNKSRRYFLCPLLAQSRQALASVRKER